MPKVTRLNKLQLQIILSEIEAFANNYKPDKVAIEAKRQKLADITTKIRTAYVKEIKANPELIVVSCHDNKPHLIADRFSTPTQALVKEYMNLAGSASYAQIDVPWLQNERVRVHNDIADKVRAAIDAVSASILSPNGGDVLTNIRKILGS
jgi:hypothetical protein